MYPWHMKSWVSWMCRKVGGVLLGLQGWEYMSLPLSLVSTVVLAVCCVTRHGDSIYSRGFIVGPVCYPGSHRQC